jgi:hypothetical protein
MGEWSASRPGRALPPGKGSQGLEEKPSASVGDRTSIVQPVDCLPELPRLQVCTRLYHTKNEDIKRELKIQGIPKGILQLKHAIKHVVCKLHQQSLMHLIQPLKKFSFLTGGSTPHQVG